MLANHLIPGLSATAAATGLLPSALASTGWQPTQQTVNELINGGFGFFAFTYVAQGMLWLNVKFGPPWWWRDAPSDWNADRAAGMRVFLNVVRYAAAATVMLGGFAWFVGRMKGTL